MPASSTVQRSSVQVGEHEASFLRAGDGPVVLLLHGTYWSRVWQPVMSQMADRGLQPVAVDLPGCGRSGGELTLHHAAVPALAAWVERFVDTLRPGVLAGIAGHDIGGAIAQHLLVASDLNVDCLALVNSVTYDSWPVPAVARFREEAVVAATSVDEIVAARRNALTVALARPALEAELIDYLSPWTEPRVARSWMALAGAADCRYTMELMPALRADHTPKLLVWGGDDQFQPIAYAERFVAEVPAAELVPVPAAGHIPMENEPIAVADLLIDHFARRPR